MHTLSSRRALLTLAAAIAFVGAPTAFAQSASKPLTPVSFRLDWKPGGQHAPFYLGKERGYYAAEGIDLTIISGSGSADSVKQLGAGAVDLARSSMLSCSCRQPNKKFRSSPWRRTTSGRPSC